MAPRKLFSVKHAEHKNKRQIRNKADEEPSHDSDEKSNSGSDREEFFTALVPPKKPNFVAPHEPARREPVENGSECSSPSASGFIIMPAVKPRGEKKKTLASKKFCDEDEIALLKGLAVFWANGRSNKWAEFHQFIKDELRNQFSKTQVSEKIRKLKQKFENNLEKARANGSHLDFSDSHESLVFELSKALWGDEKSIVKEGKGKSIAKEGDEKNIAMETRENAENEKEEANKTEDENEEANKKPIKRKQIDEHDEWNKIRRKGKQVDDNDEGNKILRQGKQLDDHDEENETMRKEKQVDKDQEENKIPEKRKQAISHEDFQSAYPLLYASFDIHGFPTIAKEKCVFIAPEKAQELEEKWRELSVDACRLELRKIDLMRRDLQGQLQRK